MSKQAPFDPSDFFVDGDLDEELDIDLGPEDPQRRVVLRIETPEDTHRFLLVGELCTIGREPTNDIAIGNTDLEPTVVEVAPTKRGLEVKNLTARALVIDGLPFSNGLLAFFETLFLLPDISITPEPYLGDD